MILDEIAVMSALSLGKTQHHQEIMDRIDEVKQMILSDMFPETSIPKELEWEKMKDISC